MCSRYYAIEAKQISAHALRSSEGPGDATSISKLGSTLQHPGCSVGTAQCFLSSDSHLVARGHTLSRCNSPKSRALISVVDQMFGGVGVGKPHHCEKCSAATAYGSIAGTPVTCCHRSPLCCSSQKRTLPSAQMPRRTWMGICEPSSTRAADELETATAKC